MAIRTIDDKVYAISESKRASLSGRTTGRVNDEVVACATVAERSRADGARARFASWPST
jgi:hypothetical protein